MDKKYVYVCYVEWDYDGCSEPAHVFSNEKDAARWVERTRHGRYVELEVQ